MGKFAGGLALGLGLAAAVYFSGLLEGDGHGCDDRCGAGPECIAGRCETVVAEAEDETDDAPKPSGKNKRKRRRGRGKSDAESSVGDAEAAFRPVDDSHVPRFDRKAPKTLDLDAGSERLSDAVVNRELAKLDRKFQSCIATAAQHSDDALQGTLRYELGIGSNGRVTGVNVKAPAGLKVFGIVPCVRKAIHGHRFPAFDGPTMGVEGSFHVD